MKDTTLKELVNLLEITKSAIPKLEKMIIIPTEEPVVEDKKGKKNAK